MGTNKGNIEVLLLLCCIVGVVAFFSISLAVTNTFFEFQKKSEPGMLEKLDILKEEKERKEGYLKSLEEKRKELEKQLREKEKVSLSSHQLSENQKREMEKKSNELRKEYDLLF